MRDEMIHEIEGELARIERTHFTALVDAQWGTELGASLRTLHDWILGADFGASLAQRRTSRRSRE